MATTTGIGAVSIAISSACRVGPLAEPENSVMSAPAINTGPAVAMSRTLTFASPFARTRASDSPMRTARLIALTGGLLISAKPIGPNRVKETTAVAPLTVYPQSSLQSAHVHFVTRKWDRLHRLRINFCLTAKRDRLPL